MDDLEILFFMVSIVLVVIFFIKWYKPILKVWPPKRAIKIKYMYGFLPLVIFVIIFFTLKFMASFDVVDNILYIIFYLFLGFAWIYIGLILMNLLFDISWNYDGLNMNNGGAAFVIVSGLLGMTVIYAGANIGDGPGFWCVIFAGGVGTLMWFLLSLLLNKTTKIFERISIGRDIGCAIRFGCYLLASGIILGRASAGDWTSAYMTIVEFHAGWPILLLIPLAISIELYYKNKEIQENHNDILGSAFWGIMYLIISVISLLYLVPLY